MKNIILISLLQIIFNSSLSSSCYNIHKMIEVSDLYQSTLSFNKNILVEEENMIVCNDFILIKDEDKSILRKIENSRTLSELKDLIGLDTLENIYKRQKGVHINELISMNLKMPLPSTFYFYATYNEFTIFAEVYFIEQTWDSGKILNEFIDKELYGFEMSQIYAKVNLFTFKCDENGELHFVKRNTYATFH